MAVTAERCHEAWRIYSNWVEISRHPGEELTASGVYHMYSTHLQNCPQCSNWVSQMLSDIRTRPACAEELREGVTIGVSVETPQEQEEEGYVIYIQDLQGAEA